MSKMKLKNILTPASVYPTSLHYIIFSRQQLRLSLIGNYFSLASKILACTLLAEFLLFGKIFLKASFESSVLSLDDLVKVPQNSTHSTLNRSLIFYPIKNLKHDRTVTVNCEGMNELFIYKKT